MVFCANCDKQVRAKDAILLQDFDQDENGTYDAYLCKACKEAFEHEAKIEADDEEPF